MPAIAETLKGADLQGRFMLMAPVGTPADIIDKLSAEIAAALKAPDLKERATTLGFEASQGDVVTPAGARKFFETELAATGKVIHGLGIEPE